MFHKCIDYRRHQNKRLIEKRRKYFGFEDGNLKSEGNLRKNNTTRSFEWLRPNKADGKRIIKLKDQIQLKLMANEINETNFA